MGGASSGAAVRLAMCDLAPYAVYGSGGASAYGAWVDPLRSVMSSLNLTSVTVRASPPGGACGPGVLLGMLRSSLADVAVYPFVAGLEADAGPWTETAYPIDVTAPVFVSEAARPFPRIVTEPLTQSAWLLFWATVACMIVAEVAVNPSALRPKELIRSATASVTGDVQLPSGSRPELCVLKTWASAFSLVFVALYTAVMASILLKETVERNSLEGSLVRRESFSVTSNIVVQIEMGRSPLSIQTTSQYGVVSIDDALGRLPVLTSWPIAAMLRQHSCSTLDLSYNELTHAPVSVALRSGALPPAFDKALMASVQRGAFDGAVKSFLTGLRLDCLPQKEEQSFSPDTAIILPVLVFGAASIAASWAMWAAEWAAKRWGRPALERVGSIRSRSLQTLRSLKCLTGRADPEQSPEDPLT